MVHCSACCVIATWETAGFGGRFNVYFFVHQNLLLLSCLFVGVRLYVRTDGFRGISAVLRRSYCLRVVSVGAWVLYGLVRAGVSVCQVHDVPYNIQLAAASHCKAVERTYHVRGCRRA